MSRLRTSTRTPRFAGSPGFWAWAPDSPSHIPAPRKRAGQWAGAPGTWAEAGWESQEPENQRYCGPGPTRTHTVADISGQGFSQLLGAAPTLFPDPVNLPLPAPCNSPMVGMHHLHPSRGLGTPILCLPGPQLGSACWAGAGEELPRERLGEGRGAPTPAGLWSSVLAKPKGASFSLKEQKPPPRPVGPSPSLWGQSPGRGREGGCELQDLGGMGFLYCSFANPCGLF